MLSDEFWNNQEVYNPLSKINLGGSVVAALEQRPICPLNDFPPFAGAGVYSIYFSGSFSLYAPLRRCEKERPIYVGKAISFGGRKGTLDEDANSQSRALFSRLKDHADSILSATNLCLSDFYFRFLVVDDIWIPLAETLLITKYQPLRNIVIDGFGNHDPGMGRKGQRKSRWDVIHPGRKWAEQLRQNVCSCEEIERMANEHWRIHEPT